MHLYVTATKACLPGAQELQPATLHIVEGKIHTIFKHYVPSSEQNSFGEPCAKWIDAGQHVLLPGLVDSHVRTLCSQALRPLTLPSVVP